jgi:hypothetical protein
MACKKEEPATMPVLTTAVISNITASTATSGGSITSDGGASIIASGVCWNATANPTVSDLKSSENVGTGQFVSNITGLNGGTTYHVRAYATNAVGTAYGSDVSFLTLGQAPAGVTVAAANISATGGTLNGTVNPNFLSTTVSFEYGTTTSYGQTAAVAASPINGNNVVNVSVDISGLTPGTVYHFRLKTVNSLGTVYGSDMSFTTLGGTPTGTTQAATNISGTGATLNGIVNANYLSTTVTFEYGTTTSYGSSATATQSPVSGNTNTNVSVSVTGLTLGATYHFRVKGVNSLGTLNGNDLSFTTLNVPTQTTKTPSNVTYNAAKSGGNITSDGGAAVTARGVCWNTNPNPTITLSTKTSDGTGTGTFTSSITGLLPNTTYYVRAYATNSLGTSYGNQVTLTTTLVPPTNGLVAYYPFNGNANDASGHGYNGTVYGATLATDRFNNSNSAYLFVSANTNYIQLNSPVGNFGTSNFTISVWTKRNTVAGWEIFAQRLNNGNWDSMWWELTFGGFSVSESMSNHSFINGGVDTLRNNVWYNFIGVRESNTIKLYVNGELYGSNTTALIQNVINTSNTLIGCTIWGVPVQLFDGKIDDIRLYNRALSAAEIQSLFHEGGW